ncbi:hypothetical protein VTJ49DRAFT_3178 [Mycothermus thermophilus]|uniref:C2H2-type domain-containing protein n=1 Tax=Humicola insolens TaxID=85995 RepID=A0ABR3V8K5_HUMIN
MPGLPGTLGVGMRGLGRYGSTPGHNQGAPGFGRDAQTLGTGHGLQQVPPTPVWTINNFMNDPAPPWNPIHQPLPHQPAMFTTYRSHQPPSEAETTNRSVSNFDSGYRTGSICGDVDQNLDPSILSRMQTMGQESIASNEKSRRRAPQVQRPASTVSSTGANVCPECNHVCKNPSEYKKHLARHTKPCKCDIGNCRMGFANSNDLERHKRSVHRDRSGGATIYRCTLGQCRGKEKDWPRLDNFKLHLYKIHKVDCNKVDFKQFVPSYPSEDAASSATAAQAPWTDTELTHVSPADLISGDLRFDHAGSVVSYPGQFMGESSALVSAAPTSSYVVGPSPESSRLRQETEPVISVLRIPRPCQPDANTSDMHHALVMGSSTCVAPAVLTQAPAPQSLPPPTATQNGSLDVGHDVEAQLVEVRSEPRKAGSTVAGEMELDGGAEEPASEYDDRDRNSEPDEPDNRSNFVRDAETELLGAGQVDFKEPRSLQRLSEDSPQSLDLDDIDGAKARAVLMLLLKKGTLPEMLKEFGLTVSEDSEAGEQKPLVGSSATSDNGRAFKCEEIGCDKTFSRHSELNKHKRRHTKPYACTFPDCKQKFGSKSDWKRHENNQHVQHPIWLCEEKSASHPGQTECGAVFHLRDGLKDHLRDEHQIHDPAVLDKKLTDYGMGRNFESRFWCGFCQKVIKPTGSDGPAHSERFDHIDDHFNGRGGMRKANIGDWKHLVRTPRPSSGQSQQDAAGPVGDQADNGHRKRGHSESGDAGPSRAKRHKDGNGKLVFWICCSCGMYWDKQMTLAYSYV